MSVTPEAANSPDTPSISTAPVESDHQTKRKRWWIFALIAVVALGALWAVTRSLSTEAETSDEPETSTAELKQEDLVNRESVSGTLEFGDSADLTTNVSGVVTWTAPEGKTVKRNGKLWKINQDPTLVFIGSVPAYRTLGVGNEGRDVKQLEANLKKLGYDGFTADNYYSSTTADAVARWQNDVGLPDTGTVNFGQVVFRPAPVRVSSVLSPTGSSVQTRAPILRVTGNERVVKVALEAADQSLADVGDSVVVSLPDGKDIEGTIVTIGTTATADAASGAGQTNTSATDATIPVTIELRRPRQAKDWDSAPVDVALEADRAEDVLTAPVTALLALTEGGYAVEVQGDGGNSLVAVDTGMFAGGRVEVKGNGLVAGTVVVVPKG